MGIGVEQALGGQLHEDPQSAFYGLVRCLFRGSEGKVGLLFVHLSLAGTTSISFLENEFMVFQGKGSSWEYLQIYLSSALMFLSGSLSIPPALQN